MNKRQRKKAWKKQQQMQENMEMIVGVSDLIEALSTMPRIMNDLLEGAVSFMEDVREWAKKVAERESERQKQAEKACQADSFTGSERNNPAD